MAHALVTQVLERGNKFSVVKITIKGDGASGELNKAVLFDASAIYGAKKSNKIMDISYNLNGFTAELFWGSDDTPIIICLANGKPYHECFFKAYGGLSNSQYANYTGDILISTSGLAAQTYDGHIILRIAAKG